MSKNWKIDFKSSLESIDTPELHSTLDTYLWGLESVCVIVCIFLIMYSANALSKNMFSKAAMTFSGGVLAGISPYLAHVFLF